LVLIFLMIMKKSVSSSSTGSGHHQPVPARPWRGKRPNFKRALLSILALVIVGGVGLAGFAFSLYMMHLNDVIRAQFEGKRWAVPAKVYARPLEVYPGETLSADQLMSELELLRYRQIERAYGPGTYSRENNTFEIITRDFTFWDGDEPSQRVQVTFLDDAVESLRRSGDDQSLGLLRMEPAQIAGIYPAQTQAEDRILVKREEIPPVLVDALIAMEDRGFYRHFGVDPEGIGRAFVANLKAGKTVQGGSTLTQQLVKNFFLTNERTLERKLTEMLMAILVEWHYTKDEILEAYANEVYLGQDGDRAIHGLGLASDFYFGRPLQELDLHHIATLVGLIKGPSLYDPRRRPERAEQRRALVLDVMVEQGLISPEDAATAKQMPLDVVDKGPGGDTPFPAFLDLVKRQLRQYYQQADLLTEGLRVFTTLDPQVQEVAEKALVDYFPKLEKVGRLKAGQLQGAAVIADTQTGEVKALVGGRDVRLAGFNRALDAKRPAGSLLKPAIYLTALEYPNRYTLVSRLNDAQPIVYRDSAGNVWKPANYDKRFHGYVMLQDSLARSYNVATARLGMDLDVIEIIKTLQRLGIDRDLPPYPSLLLGAVDITPFEIAQIYESLASGGFRIPLRAIREVTTGSGEPLKRYELNVKKVIEPGPAYLITHAMQRVFSAGTAKAANKTLSPDLGLAGKTGTTDDLRDSWFAGFSGNLLSVVWLGRDDNKPIRLSGARGALRVWIDIMKHLQLEPLDVTPPYSVETVLIDPRTGRLADEYCRGAQPTPFLVGSVPQVLAPCAGGSYYARADNDPSVQPPPEPRQSAPVRPPVVAEQPRSSQPDAKPKSDSSLGDFFRRLLD
jgi:penicillin-binding protein 1B